MENLLATYDKDLNVLTLTGTLNKRQQRRQYNLRYDFTTRTPRVLALACAEITRLKTGQLPDMVVLTKLYTDEQGDTLRSELLFETEILEHILYVKPKVEVST